MTVGNASWNGSLANGASVQIGFNGSYTDTNTDPTAFTLNGTACNGQPSVPQLVVEPTAVTVPEGRTATYTVRLSSAPSEALTIVSNVGPGDTDITVSAGASLTFTPQNWQTNQTVTLAAADADSVNGSRTIAVRGPNQTPVAVVATEADTHLPPPNPIVTPTVLPVPEGGSATVSVRFPSQPPWNVTLTTVAGAGDPDLTICAGGTLTFTPANWNTIQTIRICAAEDADSVNGTRTFILSSVGLASLTITATEVDNDPPVPPKWTTLRRGRRVRQPGLAGPGGGRGRPAADAVGRPDAGRRHAADRGLARPHRRDHGRARAGRAPRRGARPGRRQRRRPRSSSRWCSTTCPTATARPRARVS